MRVQWIPNYIREDHRICLTRLRWERGKDGEDKGHSTKLSISLCWMWRDLWIGLFVKPRMHGWYAWVCLLPCIPIRLSYQRSYGGCFP